MLRSKSMEAHRPSLTRRISSREKKLALLQDVDRLKKKLRHEENVHRALERAFTRPLGTLPRLPPYLPPYTLELLAEVAVLEEEVVRLEEQVVLFRKGLYLEAANISSSNKNVDKTNDTNDLCLVKTKVDVMGAVQAETKLMTSSKPQIATPKNENLGLNVTNLDDGREKENQCRAISIQNKSHSPKQKPLMVKTSTKTLRSEKKTSEKQLDPRKSQLNCRYDSKDHVEAKSPCLRDESPNLIAENILNCLLNIFSRITTSSNKLSTENFPPSIPSPFLEDDESNYYEDPYDVGPRFGKSDIGPYKYMCVVDGQSINANTKLRSLSSFRRLRILLKELASVKLHSLTHQEKLAFWINVYNSCMMNGYLEHGIPENPEKVVELMQKATINVGGRMLNAITIEHFILRLPYHSKYTFAKGTIKDGMIVQNTFGLELSEPLVTFALSCGSWSSPAVRIYTASEVENELEVAKREYLQAAISISNNNKLIIPKLLDWYLLDFAKDLESLVDWICLQLPTPLRKYVMKCLERAKNEPLSQIVHFLPYNFSFRYILHRSN